MRLGNRRPGTSTTFIDATSGEGIFQVASDGEGILFMAYHLYDARGELVAQSAGLEHAPDGLTVRCSAGELLLDIPENSDVDIQYRFYNGSGHLLTSSDGFRTKIYPLLRMEGVNRYWAPPTENASQAAEPARAVS